NSTNCYFSIYLFGWETLVIYLRYMQECSYEEIAEIMQISVPACRKLLYRTLLKLKHNNTLVLFYLLLSINVG
ncbi:RNA polymerase sigma factor, partial [Bacteroides fragilis]|uniref:RNA polymerase sigma factor n=1 Tax=Bacteroides fragilis TaxID=817 RepID=UPI00293E55D8